MNPKNNNLQKNQQQAVNLRAEKHQFYSGPIPHPELFSQYEEIVPGSANRILLMAENEAKNRQENETLITKNIVKTTNKGILFAFLSVIIMSSLVAYALYLGKETAASTIAVGSIAAVAGVFMFFRRSNTKTK